MSNTFEITWNDQANESILLEDLCHLVQLYPVFGSPTQIQALEYCASILEDIGFDVNVIWFKGKDLEPYNEYIDVASFGNEYADYRDMERPAIEAVLSTGKPGKTIVLNGHIDVEPTKDTRWQIEYNTGLGAVRDTKISGRGTSDMLGGIACYLCVLRQIAPYFRTHMNGELVVHLVVDEEIGGNGSLGLLTWGRSKIDEVIIAEPTEGRICLEGRGFQQFFIQTHGLSKHMAQSVPRDNAIGSIARVVLALEDAEIALQESIVNLLGRILICGQINGGIDGATPAPNATVECVAALPPTLTLDGLWTAIRKAWDEWDIESRIELVPGKLAIPAFSSDINDLALALKKSGVVQSFGEFASACDARLYASRGASIVVCGPGSLSRAHSNEEFVYLTELINYCQQLGNALVES